MFSLFGSVGFFYLVALCVGSQLLAVKVTPSIIITSVEGQATSVSLDDELSITLDGSSVGKKFSDKSVLKTGKNGKVGLLFSNGVLITIKPGSSFYLRRYKQKIVTDPKLPNPSELKEEPSNSELFAHLDFGDLVVKAPKLKKGSTMVLSSPLGTAGIRGTMFQLIATRNPITGDISGGVNLISGDIDFTDTSGNSVSLVSGQSIVSATSKLGENLGSQDGELVDLGSIFGPSLLGGALPPAIDMLFPAELDETESGDSTADQSDIGLFAQTSILSATGSGGGWEIVHKIASDVFFDIEESENSSSSFSFESMQFAVTLDTPNPELGFPSSPAILSGVPDSPYTPDPFQGAHPFMELKGNDYLKIEMTDRSFSEIDPWITARDFLNNDISNIVKLISPPNLRTPGTYNIRYEVTDLRGLATSVERTVEVIVTPPSISLNPGRHGVLSVGEDLAFAYLVKKKFSAYPVADDGPFQITSQASEIYPSYAANYYDGSDLTNLVQVTNLDSVDYSSLGDAEISFVVDDFSLRRVNLPSGSPVTTSASLKIKIIDNLPPILSVSEGVSNQIPYRVEGTIGGIFNDPGISILDNYYSEQEIEANMGYAVGSVESAFGSVNMEIAGIYEISYQGITDPSGNEGASISRWVEVYDETSPELTIYGANPLFVDVNDTTSLFRDPGAIAFDNLDGEIEWESGKITVSMQFFDDNGEAVPTDSTIDEIVEVARTQPSLNKTFQMIYSYVDAAGNEGTTTRQIVLINSPFDAPFILDNAPEDNPLLVDVLVSGDVNTGLRDPGVTAYKDFGGNLEPQNLTSLVTANQYIGGVLGTINDSVVNYSLISDTFVDPDGNPDESFRSTIYYYVQDEFGNEANYTREVRVVDRVGPVISLTDGSEGGPNFNYLQAGFPFQDPGFQVSDNYDQNVTVNSTLLRVDTGEELDFGVIADIGFVHTGSYEIRYDATDQNGNMAQDNGQSQTARSLEVIDTIKPQVALIPHSFVRGTDPSLSSENDPSELAGTPILDASNPMPDEIVSSLSSIPGWTGTDFDDQVLLTLNSESDFYVFVDQNETLVEDHPNPIILAQDEYGRYRYRFSAFYLKDSETDTVLFEDPGIYVRNDSSVPLEFSASLDPIPSQNDSSRILSYKVNYYVSQQVTGESNQLIAGRTIYIIDQEKPTIQAEPITDGVQNFVVIEASKLTTSPDIYTDLHGSSVKVFYPNIAPPNDFVSSQSLTLTAVDALDGLLSSRIVRTLSDENGNLAQIFSNSDQSAVETEVRSFIDATALDAIYTIEYYVDDIPIDPQIPANRSDSVFRHLIVKDTKAPTIEFAEFNSTLEVNYASTANPDVGDILSVATHMLTGLSATDANNFDENLSIPLQNQYDNSDWQTELDGSGALINATYNSKWILEFDPAFVPGAIYPEVRDSGPGYEITISVKDQSGNESDPVLRYLKVGDFEPPVITLIGKSEIHDFMRYGSNANSNTNQSNYLSTQGNVSGPNNTPFLDRPFSSSQNPDLNATGFQGGEHRYLLADYNFVDPGVYAEDDNAYFDIQDNYPDLDGDGVGEGHAIIRVGDRTAMDDCSNGPGIIHVYSFFEKNSYTMKDWQDRLLEGSFGFSTANADLNGTGANASLSNAKVPDVNGEDSGGGQNYADINKTDLTNFDMTIITLEYRVMDGWENKSEITTRNVYIYESRQYNSFAFYATPVSDAAGGDFEQFHDNGTGDPFLTSARKDIDGDGVSDFWEMALGTDYKNASDFPDMTDEATFKNLSAGVLGQDPIIELQTRLGRLNDASALKNVSGLGDFNATLGL